MYIYILSSAHGTLYIGVTNNIFRRVQEHEQKLNKGFTATYSCIKLAYFEIHYTPAEAIDREKQIKRWSRVKKERLIRSLNPGWMDLFALLPKNKPREEQQ